MSIKRILVADDEDSIRWVLSKAFSKRDYQVDLVIPFAECLGQHPADAVLIVSDQNALNGHDTESPVEKSF